MTVSHSSPLFEDFVETQYKEENNDFMEWRGGQHLSWQSSKEETQVNMKKTWKENEEKKGTLQA